MKSADEAGLQIRYRRAVIPISLARPRDGAQHAFPNLSGEGCAVRPQVLLVELLLGLGLNVRPRPTRGSDQFLVGRIRAGGIPLLGWKQHPIAARVWFPSKASAQPERERAYHPTSAARESETR